VGVEEVKEEKEEEEEEGYYVEAWRIICVRSFPDPDLLDPLS
jgi:hypothetical protein